MADMYNFVDINGNVIEENLHATHDSHGLMCPQDKAKLAGIEEGANKITVDAQLSSTSTNPVQNKVIKTAIANNLTEAKAYVDAEIEDLELISIEDIDAICGGSIQYAEDVMF